MAKTSACLDTHQKLKNWPFLLPMFSPPHSIRLQVLVDPAFLTSAKPTPALHPLHHHPFHFSSGLSYVLSLSSHTPWTVSPMATSIITTKHKFKRHLQCSRVISGYIQGLSHGTQGPPFLSNPTSCQSHTEVLMVPQMCSCLSGSVPSVPPSPTSLSG